MTQAYDPITAPHCQGQAYAPSFWSSTVALPTANAALQQNLQCDVAIIGGGFSGLLTAYYLASEHQLECAVFEANQVGFGASARNAGFVLKGSGRLSYPQMAKKWGMATCQGIYQEFSDAVARVEGLIQQHGIACEPQAKGYIKIAHNQTAFQNLQAQADFLRTHLGADAEFISREDLQQDYMAHQQAFGALRLRDGFGLNPLKLLLGYRDMAIKAGVKLFEHTLATDIQQHDTGITLKANGYSVTAKKLVIAGNAYNQKVTHPSIDKRFLPILSSVMVTRPLTETELTASGLQTHQVAMDTRTLKYYYRLLPDNRLLFGGRGAIYAKDQDKAVYLNNLRRGLGACFPSLQAVPHDYYWHGYIAAAIDDMPHAYYHNNIGYLLGYCGAGVSFSAQAAYRMAQQVAGIKVPNLPLYSTPLPYLPFAQLRRIGQWGYYQYAQIKDKLG
ncbi:NAD(P)/FAD-dependent oxidoreductase [Pseudoalteromonas fenneropenaei]|uniref:NAD(P)/FAD-dependent oxidoreductase n=1 Tax=Pseudoalteromonas fenneropenaei TaxID=1737459 RepID=A0ABV7CJG3_9GAMM